MSLYSFMILAGAVSAGAVTWYDDHLTGHVLKRQLGICNTEPSHRTDCHPEPGANQQNCQSRGCCWKPPPNQDHGVSWCFHPRVTSSNCQLTSEHRSDCHPESGASSSACLSRGCCWQATNVKGAPYCFHPSGEDYSVASVTNGGASVKLTKPRRTHWPRDLLTLQADVTQHGTSQLRLKIYDPNSKRYEVPLPLNIKPASGTPDFTYNIRHHPFGFTLTRKSSNTVVFDIGLSPLIFSDQMIQISVGVPTTNLYGIGENRKPFRIQTAQSPGFTLWARDIIPKPNTNLYGSHPFVLGVESNGDAFGIFLLNSNAMRIDVIPTSPTVIRYRAIGGILDFFIFTGPQPDDVIAQYWALIGPPPLPPYWSLGYHLSRWNYGGSSGMQAVIQRMRSNNMPFDTIWSDIDYMVNKLDWTYDKQKFGQLPTIVNDLHSHGQKYVFILDPGISSTQPRGQYGPYDDGDRDGIFIKKLDGTNLVGEVWPGKTVFPDFSNPKSEAWWEKHARSMHSQLPFDGLWIDMNEPSNFKDGSDSGCTSSSYDNPPYTPPMEGGSVISKTVCPSAKQFKGDHYNVHNLYGYFEGKVTYSVLKKLLGKRPFILSRSTFAGSGNHVAHWEGDNEATWSDLYYSIPEVLSFNMFGIPFTGVDICGFRGRSEEELCTRWLQLGVFLPFMRSHNTLNEPDKDPAAPRFSSSAHARNRKALQLRYRLLPFLYSMMSEQKAVVRPLVFQYPSDSTTYNIDKQFLWGKSLLVSPVLQRGHTSVNAYFPHDTWYDFYTGKKMTASGSWSIVSAPLDTISVHIRGGSIIPTQVPGLNTVQSRQNDFGLTVAISSSGKASGFLYWDDGESIGAPHNYIQFQYNADRLVSVIQTSNYHTTMNLGSVDIYGVQSNPSRVTVNGHEVPHTFDSTNKVLHTTRLHIDLLTRFEMTW